MAENLNAVRSIRTISGQYVNVFEPNPDTLLIEDIAHALSNQCRFGGHLPRFYSVAQHSILCHLVAKEEEKYDALMHDASEAYLLDFPKPIKLEIAQYNEIEHNLMLVLAEKFKFNYPKSEEVERVDRHLLEWEWNSIMLEDSDSADKSFPPIECLTPEEARNLFMVLFKYETEKRQNLVTI
jgi:hypothetical protein